MVGRPYIDLEASDTTKDGDLLVYENAVVRSIIIRATDAVEGWTAATIARTENNRDKIWDLEVH